MKNWLNKIDVRIYAALGSVLLSLAALSVQNPINNDGMLYIHAADAFNTSGFSAAFALYNWPFYSILIAYCSKLSHLSLLNTAYVLNIIFLITITTAFVTLLKTLHASRSLMIIGAVIILAFPQLNHYRDYVIRDFGYWAFSLLALWQLLLYAKSLQWRHALGWNIAMIIAGLFRMEGLILLVLSPLMFVFIKQEAAWIRVKAILKLCVLPLIAGVLLLIWHSHHNSQLGRLPELAARLKDGWSLIATDFKAKLLLINQNIMDQFSNHDTVFFLASGLVGIYIYEILSALGLLYILLCGHTLIKNLLITDKDSKIVLYVFAALNLIIPFGFLLQSFILSGRYLLEFCLVLLLLAPFSLHKLWINWQQKKTWLFPVAVLCLIVMLGSGLINFGSSKAYITQAGHWLAESTPSTATVYSNSQQVLFYAQRQTNSKNYDYLALQVDHGVQTDNLKKQPIKVFSNTSGDAVWIFKTK